MIYCYQVVVTNKQDIYNYLNKKYHIIRNMQDLSHGRKYNQQKFSEFTRIKAKFLQMKDFIR